MATDLFLSPARIFCVARGVGMRPTTDDDAKECHALGERISKLEQPV